MDKAENLTLIEVDRGYLIEQIDEYLAKAIADIADPNKDAMKKRTVNVKIEFAPTQSRREAKVSYLVSLTPATHTARESTVFMGKAEDGTPIAKPWVPNQQALFTDEETQDLETADNSGQLRERKGEQHEN